MNLITNLLYTISYILLIGDNMNVKIKSYWKKDELNRNEIAEYEGKSKVSDLEDKLSRCLKGEGIPQDKIEHIVKSGGLKIGCYPYEDHIASRIYNHFAGFNIDVSYYKYHTEQFKIVLEQYKRDCL